MALNFNPAQTPQAPNLGAVASLLGQAQKSAEMGFSGLDKAVGAADQHGKDTRSSAVNDLIASGALEGLDDVQAQQLIAKTAGGTTNKQSQDAVTALLGSLQNQGNIDATATAADILNQNKVKATSTATDVAKEVAKTKAQTDAQARLQGSDIARDVALTKVGVAKDVAKTKAGTDAVAADLLSTGKVKAADTATQVARNVAKTKQVSDLELAKAKKVGKAPKETTLSKMAAEQIGTAEPGEFAEVVAEEFEDYISDKKDSFWDRELDSKSKNFVKQSVTDYMQTPAGLEEYQVNGIEGVYNTVKSDLKKSGLEFGEKFAPIGDGLFPNFLNPFSSSFQRTIQPKK